MNTSIGLNFSLIYGLYRYYVPASSLSLLIPSPNLRVEKPTFTLGRCSKFFSDKVIKQTEHHRKSQSPLALAPRKGQYYFFEAFPNIRRCLHEAHSKDSSRRQKTPQKKAIYPASRALNGNGHRFKPCCFVVVSIWPPALMRDAGSNCHSPSGQHSG